MSKKEKKSSPERLVLALVENAHFDEALVLLDNSTITINRTPWLYAKALASFGAASSKSDQPDLTVANAHLHQAFAHNNFVLPLMVARVNDVSQSKPKNTSPKNGKTSEKTAGQSQTEAKKYIDLWFGSWLQTENAFDWLGNQFVEWTRVTREEKLRAQQEKMLANAKKLDIDFFLN